MEKETEKIIENKEEKVEQKEPEPEPEQTNISKDYPAFEKFINISFTNLTPKRFYSIIRDIIVKGNFELENEKISTATLLNDVLYEILHKLNIEDQTLRKKCLIKIPKKKQKENSKYYKKYYQNNKEKIIEKNLKRYYDKKEII